MILGAIFSALAAQIPALATVIGNTVVKSKETEAARQGNENENGKDVTLQWLTSVNRANEIKAENQTERQVIFAMIMFALPTGLVFGAAMVDGIPFYIPLLMDQAHKVGSWKIGIAPDFKDVAIRIIDSFFISAPAVAGASILAKVFRRK
jgi:hypothetical protein